MGKPLEILEDTVLRQGLCVGCGACAVVEPDRYSVAMNPAGQLQAVSLKPESVATSNSATKVCPFSDAALNEDELGRGNFDSDLVSDDQLGAFFSCYAGFVREGEYRERGSSGGIAKWLLSKLLQDGIVDYVIQVASGVGLPGTKFKYAIFNKSDDVISGSRSAYHPVDMSSVLNFVESNPGRYAITGVPCFVKAVRLLQRQKPVFAERIVVAVGIVCGHLKSTHYADMLAWQLGVSPGQLKSIDFRAKFPGRSAKEKGVVVESVTGQKQQAVVQELFGANYNDGLFQYRACDYCDDVVAELADVSIGDAWLPKYIKDGRGTSLVISRNARIQRLFDDAQKDGSLHLEKITTEDAVASQIGGFRQRREGLAYRLYLADRGGEWRPQKRVKAGWKQLTRRRRSIYRMRQKLSERSHVLFQAALASGDWEAFQVPMQRMISEYGALYRIGFWGRVKKGLARRVARLRRWWGGLVKE